MLTRYLELKWQKNTKNCRGKNNLQKEVTLPGVRLLFSCSVVSDSLWPHGLQHARLPCPSLCSLVCSDSCPLSQWFYPTISSCHPLSFSLFSSIFPSIRVFSNELALHIKWPKYWSFSISSWYSLILISISVQSLVISLLSFLILVILLTSLFLFAILA